MKKRLLWAWSVLLVAVGGGVGMRRLASLPRSMVSGAPGLSAPVSTRATASGSHDPRRPRRCRARTGPARADRFFRWTFTPRGGSSPRWPAPPPSSRAIRIQRFRDVACRAVAARTRDRAPRPTGGVNAGLRRWAPRRSNLLLRQTPAAWTTEDSLLVVLSMFITLQESDGSRVDARDDARRAAGDVRLPRANEWDTPVVGGRSTPRRSRPRRSTCARGAGGGRRIFPGPPQLVEMGSGSDQDRRAHEASAPTAATTRRGQQPGQTARDRRQRLHPTVCRTSSTRAPPGPTRPAGAAAPGARRDASGRAGDGRRQQHPRGLGLHHAALERRCPRARSVGRVALPHA